MDRSPADSLTRWAAGAVVVGLGAAGALLLVRGLQGRLEGPIAGTTFLIAGTAAGLAAVAAARLRRGGPCLCGGVALAIAALGAGMLLPGFSWGSAVAFFLPAAGLPAALARRGNQAPRAGCPSAMGLPRDLPEHGRPLEPLCQTEEDDAGAEDSAADELPPDGESELLRSRGSDGRELITGWVRVRLAGGRFGVAHVPFCPPLVAPRLEARQVSGPPSRVKVSQVLPQGARIEVKSADEGAAGEDVVIEFAAHAGGAVAGTPL